ncbi:hypothetical protein C8Q79DRAFT_617019 [Trametes meyenii]|nr:hypothetical protein C8Q79DRAFT_617019 [Trametes meyenii]
MDQCPAIPENIALLAGPQVFGHLFNYGLFGILIVQTYNYHLSFPDDPRPLKTFIYSLFVLECLQIVMATHDAFAVLGAGWGNYAALNSPQWLWFDTPVLSGIISASVQTFYAWRLYVLSGSPLLGVFISMVAVMQGSGAAASGIMARVINDNAEIQEKTLAPLIVWLGGSAACDIIIATLMLYFLSRSKSGLASDAMISRLIRLTVETGCATASVACVDLILFLVFRHNNLHMTPASMLSKLYTNSLMVLFNNRTHMRSLGGRIHTPGSRFWSSRTGPDGSQHTDIASGDGPRQFALRKFPAHGGDGVTDDHTVLDSQKPSAEATIV